MIFNANSCSYIYIYIYICKKAGRLQLRLPFYLVLHQDVGEGASPFPGLLHFTLDPYIIMPSAKERGIKYHFLSRSRIEPRSPRPLANTLTIMQMAPVYPKYRLSQTIQSKLSEKNEDWWNKKIETIFLIPSLILLLMTSLVVTAVP